MFKILLMILALCHFAWAQTSQTTTTDITKEQPKE
jgi:hypothetical protein